MISYHRHRTNFMVTHDLWYALSYIARQAANVVEGHHLSGFHSALQLLLQLRLSLHLYSVQNLATTGIRLRDPKHQLMLPFAIDDPG
jgi:hypothetical protein